MSEYSNTLRTDLDEYQDYVRMGRFPEAQGTDWRFARATHISEEQLEFLTQHGPGMNILLPAKVWNGLVKDNFTEMFGDLRTQQDKMADEMGDLLWFVTDTIDRNGQSVSDVATQSIQRHVPASTIEVTGFEHLDKIVTANAEAITVLPKFVLENRLYNTTTGESEWRTSLAEHPGLLYSRIGSRVIRALSSDTYPSVQPTAVDMEESPDINTALGDMLLVMAYIARDRLGTDLQMIADFNAAKLDNRIKNDFDKSKDISFTDFRESFEYAQ